MYLALRELTHHRLRSLLIGGIVALIAFMVFMLTGLTRGLAVANAHGPAVTVVVVRTGALTVVAVFVVVSRPGVLAAAAAAASVDAAAAVAAAASAVVADANAKAEAGLVVRVTRAASSAAGAAAAAHPFVAHDNP